MINRVRRKPGGEVRQQIREAILADYTAGVPVGEIAQRHNVSGSYPTILARRHGLTRRSNEVTKAIKAAKIAKREAENAPAPKVAAPCPVNEVLRLSAKGIGISAIGALLRCSYRDVMAALDMGETA
ncbi:hypothetical protein [Phyllobacterium chamaecytisi]|uniref:hypothetical protein n=1 Tax=Phyllobacterium chamaecytisi TaxID=2876082 RepID=UPI001CCA618F|nr:hypothetical protein [Phyllobacterium sp. KW56]MBZ9600735.1 hypothetical protein [Phyllobacterium sp. KW56]